MFLTDYIRFFDNAIPEQLCDEIIARFNASEHVVDNIEPTGEGQEPVEHIRSFSEIVMSKHEEWNDIKAVMMKLAELAVGKYQQDIHGGVFPEEIGCEHYRVKKYSSDPKRNDHHDYHVDVNNYASARRFLSIFWYLNTVDGGGDTFFPHTNVRVGAKKGRVLMFPSVWMYAHSGERPVTNDKYILTTYLHYI